ncbi:hypothetical protein IQ268_09825 [Oculatella sp. LEGE 06141]|uniref:hypothetical protein n=1 Tax=Oculatella sp. LEGE 06141 TaxID=1828648 RepID=UPI001882F958|nr:hypothetical protein [Oculatella sp. LEGE 06141]MBE9178857.1 hypothetical protein [Oculatella sp. LEGE 06141]
MLISYSLFSVVLACVLLLVFAVLQWLQIPTGNFLDWVVGAASFGWLMVVVTVPWTIYFDAKQALAEAGLSTEAGIPIEETKVQYIEMVARRSLRIVLALHLVSAASLYGLAWAGVSPVGYISSAAALLLTGLRPAVRAYNYFAARIAMIRQQFQYPRQDVVELRERVVLLETTVKQVEEQLNAENPTSWVAMQQRQLEAMRHDLTDLAAAHETFRATNHAEHGRLSREAQQAISQLTTDGQFLDHVREIIRFFKTA